jgi:hypothetical protein
MTKRAAVKAKEEIKSKNLKKTKNKTSKKSIIENTTKRKKKKKRLESFKKSKARLLLFLVGFCPTCAHGSTQREGRVSSDPESDEGY